MSHFILRRFRKHLAERHSSLMRSYAITNDSMDSMILRSQAEVIEGIIKDIDQAFKDEAKHMERLDKITDEEEF